MVIENGGDVKLESVIFLQSKTFFEIGICSIGFRKWLKNYLVISIKIRSYSYVSFWLIEVGLHLSGTLIYKEATYPILLLSFKTGNKLVVQAYVIWRFHLIGPLNI